MSDLVKPHFNSGRKHTQAFKDLIRSIRLGKKHSYETRKKMSLIHKGRKFSLETRLKISLAKKGKPLSEKTRNAWKIASVGKKLPLNTRLKMSATHIRNRENYPNWKGGITPINLAIRESIQYRLWRESVFKRDDYTCVQCGLRGGKLNADHIKRFSQYPELRFSLENGRTLCVPCHRKTDTYSNRGLVRCT